MIRYSWRLCRVLRLHVGKRGRNVLTVECNWMAEQRDRTILSNEKRQPHFWPAGYSPLPAVVPGTGCGFYPDQNEQQIFTNRLFRTECVEVSGTGLRVLQRPFYIESVGLLRCSIVQAFHNCSVPQVRKTTRLSPNPGTFELLHISQYNQAKLQWLNVGVPYLHTTRLSFGMLLNGIPVWI